MPLTIIDDGDNGSGYIPPNPVYVPPVYVPPVNPIIPVQNNGGGGIIQTILNDINGLIVHPINTNIMPTQDNGDSPIYAIDTNPTGAGSVTPINTIDLNSNQVTSQSWWLLNSHWHSRQPPIMTDNGGVGLNPITGIQNPPTIAPVTTTATAPIGLLAQVEAFASANPVIVLGGVALVIYLVTKKR